MVRASLKSGVAEDKIWLVTDVPRQEIETLLIKENVRNLHIVPLRPPVVDSSRHDRVEQVSPGTYKTQIMRAVNDICLRSLGETLLVYYSGHGVLLQDKRRYLAMPTSDAKDDSTMLPVGELLVNIQNRKKQGAIIVVIDACAVKVPNSIANWDQDVNNEQSRVTVLYSSSFEEASFFAEKQGSYFTYHLTSVVIDPQLAFGAVRGPLQNALHASHVCSYVKQKVPKAVAAGIASRTIVIPKSVPATQSPYSALGDDPIVRELQ